MAELSLRERGKQRRRAAILSTAMRLFAERGFEATTIAEIAEEAEVAPRSVSMYFPSKLDIALAPTTASLARLLDALRAEPVLPLIEVFATWLSSEPGKIGPEEWGARAAMLAANPMLGGGVGSIGTDLSHEVRARLAAELALERDAPEIQILFGLFSGVLLQFHLLRDLPSAETGSSAAYSALAGALDAVRHPRSRA